MENKLAIIQPNAVTNARYDYTQLQKDFMYYYIEAMNKHMSKEKVLEPDLFGNLSIELDMKDICKSNNHNKMLEAIKDLQKKPISYHYNKSDGIYDITTTLVASVIHKRNSGKVTIKSTAESIPIVTYLGEGFTAFNKNIALSLPSVYAKRLYELCCRWKDKGFCRMPINEFRIMMSAERKYEQIGELRTNVLDVAQKILTEQADLCFEYQLRKENGSRSFNWLEMTIINRLTEKGKKTDAYQYTYNFLYQYYKNSRAYDITEFIMNGNEIVKASERFVRMQKDIRSGKVSSRGLLAYLNTVLQREFNVPDNLTGIDLQKAKKAAKEKALIESLQRKKAAKEKAAETEKAQEPDNFRNIMQNMFDPAASETRSGGSESIAEILGKKRKKGE